MAWQKTLVVLLAFTLTGCETLRTIPLCAIDHPAGVANCAEGDEQYVKQLPELDGWIATTEQGWRKVADKLEECDRED